MFAASFRKAMRSSLVIFVPSFLPGYTAQLGLILSVCKRGFSAPDIK
jgi:hypothetical protein